MSGIRVCSECHSDLVESNSDRGVGYYCKSCNTSRRRDDVRYSRCVCCDDAFDGVSNEEYCSHCVEYGCTDKPAGILHCYYKKNTTNPPECDDHYFTPTPYCEHQVECIYCGFETNWGFKERDYGENWQEQRENAIQSDGEECRSCGMTRSKHREKHSSDLHVHHIKPLRMHDTTTEANELENLVTLCASCHTEMEWSETR